MMPPGAAAGGSVALSAFEYGREDQQVIPDARPGSYFVTVRNGQRVGWLLGPYRDHAAAVENVERGRQLAQDADPFATFYTIGTARVDPDVDPPKSVFGV